MASHWIYGTSLPTMGGKVAVPDDVVIGKMEHLGTEATEGPH